MRIYFFFLFKLFLQTPVNALNPSAAANLPQQMSAAGCTFPITPSLNATSNTTGKSTGGGGGGETRPVTTSEGSTSASASTIVAASSAVSPTKTAELDAGAQHNATASLLESMRINGMLQGPSTNPEGCFPPSGDGSANMVKVRHFIFKKSVF